MNINNILNQVDNDIQNWAVLQDMEGNVKLEVNKDFIDGRETVKLKKGPDAAAIKEIWQETMQKIGEEHHSRILADPPQIIEWLEEFRKKTIQNLNSLQMVTDASEQRGKIVSLMTKALVSLEGLKAAYSGSSHPNEAKIQQLIESEQARLRSTLEEWQAGFHVVPTDSQNYLSFSNLSADELVAQSGLKDKDASLLRQIKETPSLAKGNPVVWAFENEGSADLIAFLVKKLGANIDLKHNNGNTLLLMVIRNNKWELTQKLLELGANPHIGNKWGLTSLAMYISRRGETLFLHKEQISNEEKNLLIILLNAAEDPNKLCEFDIGKLSAPLSPFDLAIVLGHLPTVERMIAKGADLNQKNGFGYTPLGMACIYGKKLEVIDLLCSKGANVDGLTSNVKEKAPPYNNWTPLLLAAMSKSLPILQYLLDKGADPNQIGKSGWSPWTMAISEGNTEAAALLEARGADTHYGQQFLDTAFLAHTYSMKNEDALQAPLEGFQKYYPLKKLAEMAVEFLATPFVNKNISQESLKDELIDPTLINQRLSPETKGLMTETLQSAFPLKDLSDAEIVKIIQAGKPFMLVAGSVELTGGHAIGVTFCDNKLMICNRGPKLTENAIEIYELPKEQVTETLIHQLKTLFMGWTSFDFFIESLNLKHVDSIAQKDQKVGNCTWASSTSSFYALIYALVKDKKMAKQIYKEFMAEARIKQFEENANKSYGSNAFLNDYNRKLEAYKKSQRSRYSPAYQQKAKEIHEKSEPPFS